MERIVTLNNTFLNALAVSPDSTRLYVASISDYGYLYELETTFYTVIRQSTAGIFCDTLNLNPSGSRLYISYAGYDTVYTYDTQTLYYTAGSCKIATNVYISGNCLNRDGTRVYASYYEGIGIFNNAGGLIKNLRTNSPIQYYTLRSPAHSPNQSRLYALARSPVPGNLVMIDTDTNEVVNGIPSLNAPSHVVFNPNPAVYRAYVSENTGNSVKVIDTSTEEVIATIPGFDRPTVIAVNPDTHTIYVANNGSNTIAVVSI